MSEELNEAGLASVESVMPPALEISDDLFRRAVRVLMLSTGDTELTRDNLLVETPRRVLKAWQEWFAGYYVDPKEVLGKTFEDSAGYTGIVALTDIAFFSHCEHHLAPIVGKAHVAYIPGGSDKRAVGLSKLARIVQCFARRLQMQERMTAEIANALQEHLNPVGVAVYIEAVHGCMTTRGVNLQGASMKTQELRGAFKSEPDAREEVMRLFGLT